MSIQKVLEIRRQITTLREEAQVVLDKAESEKRSLTPDEDKQYQVLKTKIDERKIQETRYIELSGLKEEELRQYPVQKQTPSDGMGTMPKPFGSVGEQLLAIANFYVGRGEDKRLYEVRAASGLNEMVPAEGGFLVQQDFSQELLKRTYNTSEIPNRCRKIPISGPSNGLKMRTVDETSRADASRWGGILAYWEAEADSTTAKKPAFGRLEINLEKLMGLCYATDELLMDAAALGEIITQGFTEEFGFKLSDAIIRGTGAGQPQGILNSGALVSVAKETGQAADTIVTENILKMWRSGYGRFNAVWLYNQELEDQLETLTIAIGTGGEVIRLFVPPAGNNQYGTIKGRPAIAVEQASGPGDVGDIILADLSQYLLIDKGGIQAAESIHVQFLTDQTTFRFTYRVNGQPIWKTYLTPYKRTSTSYYVSPFVAVAAR